VVVELRRTMTPADVARICGRVEVLLRHATPVRVAVRTADLAVVDAVARMQLLARSLDGLFDVTSTDDRFAELVELAGLTDLLQVGRQAEPGEQGGLEEVVDVGDPPA
jgi:hypothetical protein